MRSLTSLNALGNKICIIGCSSCGKSTLADSLSKKLRIPAYHLDFLAHYPNSDWQRRPDTELIAFQKEIIDNDSWIIEGNYSVCMSERFAKASAVIWLDSNVMIAAIRYIRRSIHNNPNRIGKLIGAQHELKWWLLKHILFTYPKNRVKYHKLIKQYHLKCIYVRNMKQLKKFYADYNLAC